MKAECRDLERALSSGDPSLLAAFEAHALSCAACARELAGWRAVSDAAPSLHRAWSSPELWPRIHQRLAEESQTESARAAGTRSWMRFLPAAAIIALFAIATAGLLVFRNAGGREPLVSHWETTKAPLLEERAVDEVENAERTYLASIENLSRLARPRLTGATSPALMNYREKLDVLDSAIAELKSSIEQNRYNTHLRRELLAMYKEKQQTLQNLMREVKS
jgi:transposase